MAARRGAVRGHLPVHARRRVAAPLARARLGSGDRRANRRGRRARTGRSCRAMPSRFAVAAGVPSVGKRTIAAFGAATVVRGASLATPLLGLRSPRPPPTTARTRLLVPARRIGFCGVEAAAVTCDDAVELGECLDLVDNDAAHLRGAFGGFLRQVRVHRVEVPDGSTSSSRCISPDICFMPSTISVKRAIESRNIAWASLVACS